MQKSYHRELACSNYIYLTFNLINMYYHDWNLTVWREEIFKWHLPSGFTFQHYSCHSEKLCLVWQNLISVISLLYWWCSFSNDFIMNKKLWGTCLPCSAFIMSQLPSFPFPSRVDIPLALFSSHQTYLHIDDILKHLELFLSYFKSSTSQLRECKLPKICFSKIAKNIETIPFVSPALLRNTGS